MKFHDFTINRGAIHSQRLHDTSALAPPALTKARTLFHELKRGRRSVSSPPEFAPLSWKTSLGLPEIFIDRVDEVLADAMRAPGRFFCVSEGQIAEPFQINLVLPRFDERPFQDATADADARAIGTLLGLSLSLTGKPENPDAMMRDYETLWNARPCLATAVLPFTLNTQLLALCADFSTCFGAVMLLEAKN